MINSRHAVDPMCYDLAEAWLDDHAPKADVQSLAEAIQQAVEDWAQDHAEMVEGAREAASEADWDRRIAERRG